MSPRQAASVQPAFPLLTGESEGRSEGYGAYRPLGTLDYLVIYTVAGRGFFAHGHRQQVTVAGDLILIRSGTPQDYYADPAIRHWHNVWAHFIPRAQSLNWIDWPMISQGIMLLHLSEEVGGDVLTSMRDSDLLYRRGIGRNLDLGLNALERALLQADECNPRSGLAHHDPRIGRAINYLLDHPELPPNLDRAAEVADMSRSNFARLFKEQVGQTPRNFSEQNRLQRARQLLEYTRHTHQEIADQTGFANAFYLSTRFKHSFGISPKEFRRRYVNIRSETRGLGD